MPAHRVCLNPQTIIITHRQTIIITHRCGHMERELAELRQGLESTKKMLSDKDAQLRNQEEAMAKHKSVMSMLHSLTADGRSGASMPPPE